PLPRPLICYFPFLLFVLFTLHSSLSTLHSSLFTLHSPLFTLHSPLFTLHSSLFTLHSSLFTLHSSLSTLHSSLFTLHSPLFTLHSPLFTLHSSLFTLHSPLFTLHSPLFTLHSPLFTLHSPLFTLHSSLSLFCADDAEDLKKKVAVLECQLRKSEATKKGFELSTGKLLSFVENIHEFLLESHAPIKSFSSGDVKVGVSSPGPAPRHRKTPWTALTLAQEAKDLGRTVRSLLEADLLTF
ncbi:hypothetical protein NQZ68_011198, partial [Dissostichus eleginoides]